MKRVKVTGKKDKRNKNHTKARERENSMIASLEKYEEFKELEQTLLRRVRTDIRAGLTAGEICQKYEHLAAARLVSLLAQTNDPKELLPVIREIQDRASGKTVEKKEITHKLASLTDEELKALVASELTENSDVIEGTIVENEEKKGN